MRVWRLGQKLVVQLCLIVVVGACNSPPNQKGAQGSRCVVTQVEKQRQFSDWLNPGLFLGGTSLNSRLDLESNPAQKKIFNRIREHRDPSLSPVVVIGPVSPDTSYDIVVSEDLDLRAQSLEWTLKKTQQFGSMALNQVIFLGYVSSGCLTVDH